jgi:hypothetical protein
MRRMERLQDADSSDIGAVTGPTFRGYERTFGLVTATRSIRWELRTPTSVWNC